MQFPPPVRRRTQAAVAASVDGERTPLPASMQRRLENAFGLSLDWLPLHTGSRSRHAAGLLGARAFAWGPHIVLADPKDLFDLHLLAHELTHVLQASGKRTDQPGVEPADSPVEAEAQQIAARVASGSPCGPIRHRLRGIARTSTSDTIQRLINYSWNDWSVTSAEQKQVLALLLGDPNPVGTVHDLNSAQRISDLFSRLDRDERMQIAQVIGGRIDEPTAGAIRSQLIFYPRGKGDIPDNSHVFLFDISNDLQNRLRPLGLVMAAPAFNTAALAGVMGKAPTAPFGGSGATGVNPRDRPAIPLTDQVQMWRGVDAYLKLYDNPLGDLNVFLASMTPVERRQQAQLLLKQPISSLVPYSYAGKIPSRAQTMEVAARVYNLHGALIAGFVLAEQRDQSANEDAKDYQAAISILQKNTSIGLAQVVVSTAKNNNLFTDLLSAAFARNLTHNQIAMLLTSDEFSIFAAARYLRLTADAGSRMTAAGALPTTHATYPGLDMAAYARNSRTWPEPNIAALGSEYTSRPWDDVVTGWGSFVLECYRDVVGSGVF